MNAEGVDTDIQTIEPMLEALIAEHGFEAVEAALTPLINVAAWNDWQRVSNAARRIANRRTVSCPTA